MGTPFIQAQKAFNQKQEAQKSGPKPPAAAFPLPAVGGKKILQPQAAPVLQALVPKIDKNNAQVIEKEPIVVDFENSYFPDIQAAVDFLHANLPTLDTLLDLKKTCDVVQLTGKDDPKQKTDASKLSTGVKIETKKENEEDEENKDFKTAMDVEEKILKARIERIKIRANEHLKEFRNRAYQVYITLDEWVTQRFIAETQAVKDLINIIKETIEAEQKLPNKLLLVGDKVHIDFSRLLIEPEIETRSKSPIQPQSICI